MGSYLVRIDRGVSSLHLVKFHQVVSTLPETNSLHLQHWVGSDEFPFGFRPPARVRSASFWELSVYTHDECWISNRR